MIGMLKKSFWSNDGYGEVRGRMLRFEKKSFFSDRFLIKDIEGVRERGWIQLRWLRGYADIVLDGQKYTWKRLNWWSNSFRILSSEGDELTSKSDRWLGTRGTLHFDYIDPAVLLVGLYIMGVIRKRRRA